MSTRAEHYKAAEDLLAQAQTADSRLLAETKPNAPDQLTNTYVIAVRQRRIAHTIALAQVHATLATYEEPLTARDYLGPTS